MKHKFSDIVILALTGVAMMISGCDSNCCGDKVLTNPPVAVIQKVSQSGTQLTLNGTGSHDAEDGTALKSYEWFLTEDLGKTDCKGLTPVATGTNPTITLEEGKKYKVFLKVTDSEGKVDCTSSGDAGSEAPLVINVPTPQQQVACADKPADEHAAPTAVLTVKDLQNGTLVTQMRRGGKYIVSCAGSHDDCNLSIPDGGGECNFNGSSWKSTDGSCTVRPAPGSSAFYKENCQLDGRFKPQDTPVTAANPNIDLKLTTCSSIVNFDCVEINVTVTDRYGHTSSTYKRFPVQ